MNRYTTRRDYLRWYVLDTTDDIEVESYNTQQEAEEAAGRLNDENHKYEAFLIGIKLSFFLMFLFALGYVFGAHI